MTDDTTETIVIPGGRSVRASLDRPPGTTDGETDEEGDPGRASGDDADRADRVVVACPPHPQFGGNRHDGRLTALSDRLTAEGVACLRIDYGEWDRGYGERADARNAVRWARDRYDGVGIFGYSFGGAIAVLAAVDGPPVDACCSLAPASRIDEELDAAAALDRLGCPYRVIYGSRDTTADWKPLVDRARELGHDVEEFSADHHFVGQHDRVARLAAEFLVSTV